MTKAVRIQNISDDQTAIVVRRADPEDGGVPRELRPGQTVNFDLNDEETITITGTLGSLGTEKYPEEPRTGYSQPASYERPASNGPLEDVIDGAGAANTQVQGSPVQQPSGGPEPSGIADPTSPPQPANATD